MIKSAVRGVAVTALTTTFALLPTSAQAEGKDSDNDIERVELTGVSRPTTSHASVRREIRVGDGWTNRLDLYAVGKTEADKNQLRHAGDGASACSVVHIDHDRVTAQCTRVLRLKKGSLRLSDMITYGPVPPVTAKTAIVGGTGDYRSAYGDGYITLDGNHVHLKLNVDE
ncbi:hypothetical protein [Streptomyces sp. NPDC002851]